MKLPRWLMIFQLSTIVLLLPVTGLWFYYCPRNYTPFGAFSIILFVIIRILKNRVRKKQAAESESKTP